ncbi:hypothetical protein COOONC_10213 [Cooperia oncophora]
MRHEWYYTMNVPPLTDYIHANWVKFEKHDRIFIMTQAPLESTIGDFWRMVFQENCPSIVNLTQVNCVFMKTSSSSSGTSLTSSLGSTLT